MNTYNTDQRGEQATAVSHVTRLECSGCGAEVDAACTCGVDYTPARTRAAEAVAKNPEKSDRAIAEEIGVSDRTVNRARRTATGVAVGRRVGKDGRVRGLPSRPTNSAPTTGQIIRLETGKIETSTGNDSEDAQSSGERRKALNAAADGDVDNEIHVDLEINSGRVNDHPSGVAVNAAPTGAGIVRISRRQKEADRFESAIGYIANACEVSGDAELTPPDAEMAAWAVEKLDGAIRSLNILKARMASAAMPAHAIEGAVQ